MVLIGCLYLYVHLAKVFDCFQLALWGPYLQYVEVRKIIRGTVWTLISNIVSSCRHRYENTIYLAKHLLISFFIFLEIIRSSTYYRLTRETKFTQQRGSNNTNFSSDIHFVWDDIEVCPYVVGVTCIQFHSQVKRPLDLFLEVLQISPIIHKAQEVKELNFSSGGWSGVALNLFPIFYQIASCFSRNCIFHAFRRKNHGNTKPTRAQEIYE